MHEAEVRPLALLERGSRGTDIDKADDALTGNTILLLKGERDFAKRLFVFLGLKRGDTVVLTTDVFEYAQQHGDVDRDFRAAGCLEREKMAVGLSRSDPQRSAQIGNALDQGIAQLRRSGQLAKILARYGLKDWAP